MADNKYDILDWQNHAPWLCRLPREMVESWKLRETREHLWSLPEAVEEATVAEWTAHLFASVTSFPPSSAKAWAARWRATVVDRALAENSRHVMDFAGWWALQYAAQSLGESGTELPKVSAGELIASGRFKEANTILSALADANQLDTAPNNGLVLSDLTASCLERDGGVLWRSWLTGSVPAYQPPYVTMWTPDPITAKWIQQAAEAGQLSVLFGPRPPLCGALSIGWTSPQQTLAASMFQKGLSELMKFS